MKKTLLLVFLFAALKLAAIPAPNFTVTTSDNQTIQLYQDFISQGKVVVIEAFFTTCPPCNAHAPHLQTLYTQMLAAHPGKVEFILLSTLSSDNNVKVAQYKTSKNMTMPAVGANGGSTTALQPYLSGQFGPFEGTPTFFIIAPTTGEVEFDVRGNTVAETMSLISQKIAALLPAAPVSCSAKDIFGYGMDEVSLQIKTQSFDTTLHFTDPYNLSGIAALQNQTYTIRPFTSSNPLNGLTTYDLVLISKHILGVEQLFCDWQLLAADLNCSGSITTFDIVTGRKLILGLIQDLPCGSWRFIPDSVSASNGDCHAFSGVKIGDVNRGPCEHLKPLVEDRSPLIFTAEDRMLKAGESAFVTLSANESSRLNGFQAVLGFDPSKGLINDISSTLPEFNADNYSTHREAGETALSWINAVGQDIQAGQSVLMLQVTATQDTKLSDFIHLQTNASLKPEAYSSSGTLQCLCLAWQNDSKTLQYQIRPNPASSRFELSATLPKEQTCLVQMFDLRGQLVLENTFEGVKGINSWSLDSKAAAGVYFLRVNGEHAGKVILK